MQGAHIDCKPSEHARIVEPPSSELIKKGKAGAAGKRAKAGASATVKAEPGEEAEVKEALSSDEEIVQKSLKERLNESGFGGEALELTSPKGKYSKIDHQKGFSI